MLKKRKSNQRYTSQCSHTWRHILLSYWIHFFKLLLLSFLVWLNLQLKNFADYESCTLTLSEKTSSCLHTTLDTAKILSSLPNSHFPYLPTLPLFPLFLFQQPAKSASTKHSNPFLHEVKKLNLYLWF